MKNLEGVLGDILEKATGKRETPFDRAAERTELEQLCTSIALAVHGKKDGLLKKIETHKNILLDTILVHPLAIDMILIEEILEIMRPQIQHLPESQQEFIKTFIRPAVTAVSLFAHEMGGDGRHPDEFKSCRDAAVLGASLLSSFPGSVSANMKGLMEQRRGRFMSGQDITSEFRNIALGIITIRIETAGKLEEVKRLKRCAAYEGIGQFAETIFDLEELAYRHVYNRFAGAGGSVPQEILEEQREMSAALIRWEESRHTQ